MTIHLQLCAAMCFYLIFIMYFTILDIRDFKKNLSENLLHDKTNESSFTSLMIYPLNIIKNNCES